MLKKAFLVIVSCAGSDFHVNLQIIIIKISGMKRNILVLVIGCLFCSGVYGQSYKERFSTALEAKDMAKAEATLKEWDFNDANDAELYVSYFNFFTVKSMENSSEENVKANSSKALEFITEGIQRFPTRFDMRIAKIYMLNEIKEYDEFTSEIIKLIDASVKNRNDWKGEDFTLIEKPDDMFFGAILEFQEMLFKKNDPNLHKNIIKISEKMQAVFPRHTQSRLIMSTVYIAQKEFDKSLKALQAAEKYEPDNSILLYNIAYVYAEKGDKVNAKKYYELAITNITEKEVKLKEAAQKQIELLK